MKHLVFVLFLACFLIVPLVSAADTVFIPGSKILMAEDFSATPMSEIPPGPIFFTGNCEVVLIGSEHWLKAFPNTSMRVNLPSGLQDLTVEYVFKAKNYHRGIRIELKGTKGKGEINLGTLDGVLQYQGTGNGKALPTGKVKHTAYRENEINRLALVIKDQKVMIFLNKVLIMDVPGFASIFPENIDIHLNTHEKAELYVKDFVVATDIPDIAVELLEKGKYVSHGVYFDTGSAKIKEESHAVLGQIAAILKANQGLKLLIVGHTDNIGAKEANQTLSVNRANSVKDYLVKNFSIDAGRLATDGKGDTEPVADNKTVTGRAENRRVEFIKQ
ncbi:MAG: OmpA family protein [Bacteroidota bacterium]